MLQKLYSNKAHKYLFIAGTILFIIFLLYIYFCDHKQSILESEFWTKEFLKAGFSKEKIEDIEHDDSVWYYKNRPTCVAYSGSFFEKCLPYEHYCPGGNTFGIPEKQIKALQEAIDNGGEHVDCPLIYPGLD